MLSSSSAANSSDIYYCPVVSSQIAIAVSAMRTILITPVCALVLYLGYQRWRRQRSRKTSHSDMFTYHLATMELFWVASFLIYIYGYYAKLAWITYFGYFCSSILFSGEVVFHILTCVERYLAVVHPITYLGLKKRRIRNISIGCASLLSFGPLCWIFLYLPEFLFIPMILLSSFSLVVISFCNISILCILIRPKPGDGGREARRVEQSKVRAFHTITVIMGVLCLWFVGFLVAIAFWKSGLLSEDGSCILMSTSSFYNLPSSLVLPLLFLQRAGKLPCCNYKNTRQ